MLCYMKLSHCCDLTLTCRMKDDEILSPAGRSDTIKSHVFKIMAMDVYRELGSFERGLTIFRELDVKQIQVRCHLAVPLILGLVRVCVCSPH